ncbi:hypothetical protein BGW36DRAFT_389047 [Talaromyces proteolyticus]|uniref:Uncharacterized protein n=1 Tax=Talaromyces proteolyticus TaxID=1131652 RepID=A0AAD4PVQ5_9EURO|nr:uncharacterized protein BGW36DRAFT_389047 [Talaromyces proteolyticus]KAH8690610.1 hypothetical protein BGW36DRAFT_389047 [Talaromyces proteolyticus]
MLSTTCIRSIKPFQLTSHTPKRLLHRNIYLKPTIFERDRTTLHPEHSETCLSGDEDEVAHHKSSFDPSITRPEREFQTLDKECTAEGIVDPLLYSPANLTISLMLKELVKKEPHMEGRKLGSAKGWTRKGKDVHIKNTPGGPFDRYEKLIEELKKKRTTGSSV